MYDQYLQSSSVTIDILVFKVTPCYCEFTLSYFDMRVAHLYLFLICFLNTDFHDMST